MSASSPTATVIAALQQPTRGVIYFARLREHRSKNTDQYDAKNEKAERDMHVHYGTILSTTDRCIRRYCYSDFLVTCGIFNDHMADLAIEL
jgi:hypothetical protein